MFDVMTGSVLLSFRWFGSAAFFRMTRKLAPGCLQYPLYECFKIVGGTKWVKLPGGVSVAGGSLTRVSCLQPSEEGLGIPLETLPQSCGQRSKPLEIAGFRGHFFLLPKNRGLFGYPVSLSCRLHVRLPVWNIFQWGPSLSFGKSHGFAALLSGRSWNLVGLLKLFQLPSQCETKAVRLVMRIQTATRMAAVCGSAAGLISATFTTPFDLLKTRVNLRPMISLQVLYLVFAWLVGWFVGWLAWLIGWSVACLVGWACGVKKAGLNHMWAYYLCLQET